MLNYVYYGCGEEASNPTEPEPTEPESTEPETTEPEATENGDILIDEKVISESVDTSGDFMRTETVYDSNGNYVIGETDEYGNTVSYTVDGDGNVTSITDGENNTTSYTYTSHGELLSVSSGDSTNTYAYDMYSNLSSITHNGFSYNYTYDNFNAPLTISVATALSPPTSMTTQRCA